MYNKYDIIERQLFGCMYYDVMFNSYKCKYGSKYFRKLLFIFTANPGRQMNSGVVAADDKQ